MVAAYALLDGDLTAWTRLAVGLEPLAVLVVLPRLGRQLLEVLPSVLRLQLQSFRVHGREVVVALNEGRNGGQDARARRTMPHSTAEDAKGETALETLSKPIPAIRYSKTVAIIVVVEEGIWRSGNGRLTRELRADGVGGVGINALLLLEP